jgi:hypothetical protein
MARQHGPLGEKALQVLVHVALDEKANAELRGIAYISARATAGLLTPQEYARLPEDIHQLDVDWEWLHSAAG